MLVGLLGMGCGLLMAGPDIVAFRSLRRSVTSDVPVKGGVLAQVLSFGFAASGLEFPVTGWRLLIAEVGE